MKHTPLPWERKSGWEELLRAAKLGLDRDADNYEVNTAAIQRAIAHAELPRGVVIHTDVCDCESETCVAGMLLDKNNDEVAGTEHRVGNCPRPAELLITIYGQKQRLCDDCYTVSVSMSRLPHCVIEDWRAKK